MSNSGDRTGSFDANSNTFAMTNIIPQAPDNNQGPWAGLESYCRDLVRQGNEVYVICGGYGSKGTIAGGKVNVPDRTWKVVVSIPKGENDLSRIDANTRVIAVDMPNANGIKNDNWGKYRTSVADIEKATGLNFLSSLPQNVQSALKKKVDTEVIPDPVPRT